MSVTFNFLIGQKVVINEIKRPGVVTGLSVDEVGKQVRVVYWNDGKRCTEWMFEWEVS